MKKVTAWLVFMALAFCVFEVHPATSAVLKSKTVRVAYLENGPYWFFAYTYSAFQRNLAKTKGIIALYPENMHFSPGWLRPQEELEEAARKLMNNGNVDLIIGAGTAAVRALQKVNNGTTPFLGLGLTSPVASGIMAGVNDSGIDNFVCEAYPERWSMILRVFHEIVGFKKLGVLYPAGSEGRFYAGIDEAQAAGQQLGFDLLGEEIPDESVESCSSGLRALVAGGADALYLAPLMCFDWGVVSGNPERLFAEINLGYRLPSLARDGAPAVQGGALIGYSSWDLESSGKALAEAAHRIFNGEKPRSINLVRQPGARLAINLQTAMEVGVDLSFDIILAADEVYEKTAKPDLKKIFGGIK